MVPNDASFVRAKTIAQGQEYQLAAKVPQPMYEAFKELSDEMGMSMSQHLRRMVRAYLAQNLIGYED